MSARHLDGNGVAGLLDGLLGAEPTRLRRVCQECAREHPLGEHRAFRGAGLVLRCPGCNAVALVVVERGEEVDVRFAGTFRLPGG
ncbi:MAG: hypothetical protein HZB46_04650 [Solirubrobacterales bacterium]|nr:hypothetical protein [Solirubrobacterales bacterium]